MEATKVLIICNIVAYVVILLKTYYSSRFVSTSSQQDKTSFQMM